MSHRRLLTFVLAVVLIFPMVPASPAEAALSGVAPGLVRFMLASARYVDVSVEIDGAQVVRQSVNTMSGYIAIGPDRPHTIVLYGLTQIDPGPSRILSIADYRLAQGVTDSLIVAEDGTPHRPEPAPPVPTGKSILNPVLAGPVTQAAGPDLRFGSLPLRFASGLAGGPVYEIIEPRTGRLELRTFQGNRLVRSAYLRAQPGYRYDLVVVPHGSGGAEDYDLVVVPTSPQMAARPTTTRLFATTGHILEGRFQHYWEQTGGLPVYGIPLNDDHLARTAEGRYVAQVFERNRIEYHPENQAPYDVLLGRLGEERLRQLGRDWRKEFSARPIARGCIAGMTDGRQFALCEPFLSYYRTHGLELDGQADISPAESLALFGLPLTQAGLEINSSGDQVLTQWFERARLEYHPDIPAPHRVLLGRLGYEVYNLEPFTFDDEDRAFSRWSAPGRRDWTEAAGGFGGHYWWTCAEALGGEQGNLKAEWSNLPPPGEDYALEIFVPGIHSNSRSVPLTYVWDHDAVQGRLDQKPYGDAWVRLPHGPVERLVVDSNTGEGNTCAVQLAVDAIRFVPNATTR